MPLEKGITVAEAIERLQQCDPKAIIVGISENGAYPVSNITSGILSRLAAEKEYSTGLNFCPDGTTPPGSRRQQPAVLID